MLNSPCEADEPTPPLHTIYMYIVQAAVEGKLVSVGHWSALTVYMVTAQGTLNLREWTVDNAGVVKSAIWVVIIGSLFCLRGCTKSICIVQHRLR